MAYRIGNSCSTCHYCFRTCPVEAIRFVGKEYAIDEEKCIDCGKCAKVCPSGIIAKVGEEVTIQPHDPVEKKADLVVLGAGGSGLIAAVRYKILTGKNVIVLEKSRKPGGNTTLGHNFLTRYSKKHAEMGMPDLREDAIKSISTHGSGVDISENLLRKAMYAQTDCLDWLFTLGDLDDHMVMIDLRERGMRMGPFVSTPGFLDFPNRIANVTSSDHSMGPGWMGTWLVNTMVEQCEKLEIPILTETRAVHLNMDETGKFVSVTAQDPGGQVTVTADNCVIATGGFARNEKVMKQILPSFFEGEKVHTFSVAGCTGDAITMAEEIGAKFDFEHVKIPMMGPVHHPYSFPVMQIAQDPHTIMVNLNGKRFTREDRPMMGLRGPLEDEPGKVAYAIFDAKMLDQLGEDLMNRTAGDPSMHSCMTNWREELEYETTLDLAAKKADTLEELAKLTGIDAAGLAETIAAYNAGCNDGVDAQFGEDGKEKPFLTPIEQGPFYAVHLARFNEGAEGGIVNDDDLHVMKADGTPFEGLYIVGDPARGVLKSDDEGGKLGEMPWAVGSGYLVAQILAEAK